VTWVCLLAMTGGILSPYQDEDERKSIRKQEPKQVEEETTGGLLSLPGLLHLGASYYPTIQFDETDFSARSGSGIDAYFSLSTILSGIVPWHTQIGVVWVEDKADFDLTIVKLGTGVHTALGGNINLSVSFGTAYLHGSDVSGSRFTMFLEIRLGTRDLFLPGSFISIGYLNISNINARIDGVDLETIEGLMLTIGFGG
jgi:hypothetical protein